MQSVEGALHPCNDGIQSSQLSLNSIDWANNEPVLCIAVEYVKDNFKQQTDIQHAQVYTHYDNNMSMLDAHMGSLARYSPVYTETTSKFCSPVQGPVVVKQLVTDSSQDSVENGRNGKSNTNELTNNDFMQLVETPQSIQIPEQDDQDVDILITDQATGISYLVERCLNDDSQLMDTDALLDSELLALDDNALKTHLNEIIAEPSINVDTTKEVVSQRQAVKNLGLQGQDVVLAVQQICDRPIQTRARASLPISHLVINKNQRGDESVFAKKFIPSRTQFGPIEGLLTLDNIKNEKNKVHLSIDIDGVLQKLDVSNENLSNWMCFVQLAQKENQQNMILFQQENSLYFLTTRNIHPKQELLVGYSVSYADRRSLPILEHTIAEDDDLWSCYECPLEFLSSDDLQKHEVKCRKKKIEISDIKCVVCNFHTNQLEALENHMKTNHQQTNESTQTMSTSQILINDVQNGNNTETIPETAAKPEESKKKDLFKCPECYKCFATSDRIQRHMLVHGDDATKPFQCHTCKKRFLNNSALSCHVKTHLFGAKIYECPICKESFKHILQLKSHVGRHAVDGKFTCPYCKKVFVKYSIIRKHIRAFHCDKVHECPDCDKAFPTLDKLRMHTLKHSDHREFLCADCGKQFKRKDKLREHCKKVHNEEGEDVKTRKVKSEPTDYHRFIYKCHSCLLGFKRRGMLVNHLAKRHPDVTPESVPELNLPIYRITKDYYCNYCEKVYKSSSKRKAHILKNHPGLALPSGNRGNNSPEKGLPNSTYSQTVGSFTTHPQACCWCHRQYASKAKLLQHQRKKHAELIDMEKQVMNESKLTKNGSQTNCDDGNLLAEVCKVADVADDGYYQLISFANGNSGIESNGEDISNDERLYRLVNIENGLAPPR